jgi:hypothetical protein
MKKTNILILIVFAVLIFTSSDAFAQGGFGTVDGITFDDDVNDEPVPIFGHLFLILSLTIGSLIGYKKLIKN